MSNTNPNTNTNILNTNILNILSTTNTTNRVEIKIMLTSSGKDRYARRSSQLAATDKAKSNNNTPRLSDEEFDIIDMEEVTPLGILFGELGYYLSYTASPELTESLRYIQEVNAANNIAGPDITLDRTKIVSELPNVIDRVRYEMTEELGVDTADKFTGKKFLEHPEWFKLTAVFNPLIIGGDQ